MAETKIKKEDIELLIPASSPEVLRIAVLYGADAVYIGGEAFGLRAKAKNFTIEEMAECVRFAHEHNVKVYAPIFLHIITILTVQEPILKNLEIKFIRMHL